MLAYSASSFSSSSSSSSFVSFIVVPSSAHVCQPATVIIGAQCSLPDLNRDHLRSSVPCRTSTATICAQRSLPDLNRAYLRSVFPAGPQPRDRMSGDMSERMSETMSEDMSERMSDRMSERLSDRMSEPYSMHSKGLQIIETGADVSLLQSVCFELSPYSTRQENPVKKFKGLRNSSEHMNTVSGAERFASLSSGHTSQFIKAFMTCTPTTEDELSDSSGHLGGHLYNNSTDSDLKSMSQQGWTWLVLPHYVEEAHPELADLIQKALNASNSIYAKVKWN